MAIKKIDRYTGIDDNGILHNLEVHRSGVHPDSWICANCGIPLKEVEHMTGLNRGLRYCKKCFDNGRALRDMPDYEDYIMKNPKAIIWNTQRGIKI